MASDEVSYTGNHEGKHRSLCVASQQDLHRSSDRCSALLATGLLHRYCPTFPSTKINPDHSITFRYRDPGATAVLCSIENVAKPLAMHKDAEGIWTINSAPLPPGIYRYHFEINGISFLDPANPSSPTPSCALPAWSPCRGTGHSFGI